METYNLIIMCSHCGCGHADDCTGGHGCSTAGCRACGHGKPGHCEACK